MAAATSECRPGRRVVLRPAEREGNGVSPSLSSSSFWVWRGQEPRGMLFRTKEVDTRWKDLSLHGHDLFVAN